MFFLSVVSVLFLIRQRKSWRRWLSVWSCWVLVVDGVNGTVSSVSYISKCDIFSGLTLSLSYYNMHIKAKVGTVNIRTTQIDHEWPHSWKKYDWSWLDWPTQMTKVLTVMMREQMLTVPCVTTCHDLKEDADHTWGNDLPLILRHFCVKGSLPVSKTCVVGHWRIKWRTNIYV